MFDLNIIYKSDKKIIVADTLNHCNNYQFYIIRFNKVIKDYAHNKTLTEEEDLDQKFQKYNNQLKLNDDKMIYHWDNIKNI